MMMGPNLRRLVLTMHITASVGLLGAIASFLALSIAGTATANVAVVRSVYPAMQLIVQLVIVPLAFASLLTGIVQSLGTVWGLFRHYWVVVKLIVTGFATVILLIKMRLMALAASLAAGVTLNDLAFRAIGVQLTVHAAAGLLVLLLPMALSIYKPKGLTKYGVHRRRGERVRLSAKEEAI